MLHACVQIFDVTGNLEKICKILETKQHLGEREKEGGRGIKYGKYGIVDIEYGIEITRVWGK